MRCSLVMLTAACSSLAATAFALEPVLTQHNNNARTGVYASETTLTTSNVNASTFGQLFARPVDDQIYAQPLYVPHLVLPGAGTHNVVIVATVADSVYAFDADDPNASTPLWQVNLLDPGAVPPSAPDISQACGITYRDFSGNFGIVSTPVIDPSTNTLYVVARSKEADGSFVQRLHALDITTGHEVLGGPTLINPSVPGTGDGGTTVTFDALRENQRAALLLSNGVVYIAWASHNDCTPYHGWVVGYDAQTLQQVSVYNDTPNGTQGGIWMSGQGPAADDKGNLFFATGNGTTDATDFGNSVLKLDPQLNLLSFFTPYNYADLSAGDLDLNSGGVFLIPGTKLAVAGGKSAVLYVLNQDALGGLSMQQNDNQIVQSFAIGEQHIHGSPVFYSGPTGEFLYVWNEQDHLLAYKFDRSAGQFQTPYFAESTMRAPDGMPGAMLSVSTNGTEPGTGILWASHPLADNALHAVVSGILRAFDATDITHELWDSEQVSARDSVGNFAKFNCPTVANGKVYLGTFSNQLQVYGLLQPTIAQQPSDVTVMEGQPLKLSVTAWGRGLSYQWQQNGVDLPGATTSSYSKTSADLSDAGSYDVVVTNSAGSATSTTATVQVTPVPLSQATGGLMSSGSTGSQSSSGGQTSSQKRGKSGCASAGTQPTPGGLLTLGLLLAAVSWRRRRGAAGMS